MEKEGRKEMEMEDEGEERWRRVEGEIEGRDE
jgi:hypothetical protein